MDEDKRDVDKALTIHEAGRFLDVSPETVRAAIRNGKLRAQMADGIKKVEVADLRQYLDRARPDGIKRVGRPRKSTADENDDVERVGRYIQEVFGRVPTDRGEVLSLLSFRYIIAVMLSRRRRELQMSQLDLAVLFGVGRETISQMESGRTEVKSGDLARLAIILQAKISDLFGLVEDLEERQGIIQESEKLRKRGEFHLFVEEFELAKAASVLQALTANSLSTEEVELLKAFRSCPDDSRETMIHVAQKMARKG